MDDLIDSQPIKRPLRGWQRPSRRNATRSILSSSSSNRAAELSNQIMTRSEGSSSLQSGYEASQAGVTTTRTGKPPASFRSLNSRPPSSRNRQRRPSNTSTTSSSSVAQHIDLTDTPDTSMSATAAPIPSLQATKELLTRIKLLRQQVDTDIQNRACIDRTVFEQNSLQNNALVVIEASIWKHIFASAYLRVLDGKEGLIYGERNILVGYIGMTPTPLSLYLG